MSDKTASHNRGGLFCVAQLDRRVKRVARANPMKLMILRTLVRRTHVSVQDLASILGKSWSNTRLQMNLRDLEERGLIYIHNREQTDDGLSGIVNLEEKGREHAKLYDLLDE